MIKNTFAGIKKGQKFRVIANRGGHNYPMGKTLTFSKAGTDSSSMSDIAVRKPGSSHNNIMFDEIELIYETVDEMKNEIAALTAEHQDQIQMLNERIATCEELGMAIYDEDFIKVYRALEVLNSDATTLEKTALIIKLIG